MIFHAAAVAGHVGKGYTPIPNIHACVANALVKLDQLDTNERPLTSILFPLMGTGTARGDLKSIVAPLLDAAIEHLRRDDLSRKRDVYFLAWSEEERTACMGVLDHSAKVKRSAPAAGGRAPRRP